MKFFNGSNFESKVLIFLFSIVSLLNFSEETSSVKFKTRLGEKKQAYVNQDYTVWPNQYNAPTMENQLETANFTAPLFSRSLFEVDPQRKIKLSDFEEEVRFTMYNMTRGEARQIFYFMDKNKDDLLDQHEFDDFAMLYIYPFEACDGNGDYLLEPDEFKLCYDSDPISHFIRYRREKTDNYYKLIMDSITTRAKEIINFADYLLFKRATFGWKSCQSTSMYISKDSFACALRIALPIKYHLNKDVERFYTSGLNTISDFNLIELDFIGYLRTFYYSYVFIIFSNNQDIPYLGKADFLKAIRDDRIPQNFAEDDVDLLYDLQQNSPLKPNLQMNPESFFFWFNLHRLFNKYSIERPMQLSETELLDLIEDRYFPQNITHSIDKSITNFTEAHYSEASLVLQRYRANERDFFYKFKETEEEGNAKSMSREGVKKSLQDVSAFAQSYWVKPEGRNYSFYNFVKNTTMRKIFFNIPTNNGKYSWTRKIYFRTMQLAQFFTTMTTDYTFLVPITTFHEQLYHQYDIFNPPINMKQRVNYAFYKALPRDFRVDLFCFLELELWKTKFEETKLYSNKYIEETDLKIVLSDYGMRNMPDPVIDTARKGYDRLRRRIYEPKAVLVNIITVQAAAAEIVRTQRKMKTYHLKATKDWARKFQNWPRRFKASPRV